MKKDSEHQEEYSKAIKGLSAIDAFEKGYGFQMAGKTRDAIDAYSKAIELNPKYAWHTTIEAALTRDSDFRKAVEDYNKAIRYDNKDAMMYYNRSVANVMLENYREVIIDCDRAIDLDDKYALAYTNRGNANKKLGN
jgi:tetratricopeptide (TPR) repeat protein